MSSYQLQPVWPKELNECVSSNCCQRLACVGPCGFGSSNGYFAWYRTRRWLVLLRDHALGVFGSNISLVCVFSAFRLARATFRDITIYNDGFSLREWKLFRQADAEALIFWNTITSTAVELGEKGDGETFSFVIDSNGRRRVIVEERTYSDAKMETIVNLVNKHTPHIPYTWVIMGSGFVKVPRGLVMAEDRQ